MKKFFAIILTAFCVFAACSKEDNPQQQEDKSLFANTVWGIEEGRAWSGIEGTYYARIFDNAKNGRVIQWKDGEILNVFRSFDYEESKTDLTCTDHLQSGASMTFHYTVGTNTITLDNGDVWKKLK